MSDRNLTTELLARLQRHYIKPGDLMPGGMFLPEVTLGLRRADALYVGFFASRGKFLVGHELKVSRADWLHELDDPSKAEVWARECHAWYLVVPSESIIRREELPHGWGLMVPSSRTKTRMDIVVKAELHPERHPSWEATHAIVQRADSVRMDGIIAARAKAVEDASAEIEKRVAQQLSYMDPGREAKARADRSEALLAEVAEILGVAVQGTHLAWDEAQVDVAVLRSSFSAWLAADKTIRDGVYSHRVSAVRALREQLNGVERDLLKLRGEPQS